MSKTVALSIVIPTHNRPDWLRKTIASLADQSNDVEGVEIIVCDDASTHPVDFLRKEFPNSFRQLHILRNASPIGPAANRNRGWQHANADFVYFLDDDVVVHDGFLETLKTWLAKTNPNTAAGIEGIVTPLDWPLEKLDLLPPNIKTICTLSPGQYLTANIGYFRSVLKEVGGFDENFPYPASEDFDLAYRILKLGYHIEFDTNIHVSHALHPAGSPKSVAKRHFGFSTASVRLYLKHPERFPPAFTRLPLLRLFSQIFPQPTLPGFFAYFWLNVPSLIVSKRRLITKKPLLFVRWVFFYLIDTIRLAAETPLIVQSYYATKQELKAQSEPAP